MKKNSAFTLVELSVTLILIGILIAGVMQGGNLVSAARLAGARSATIKSPVGSMSGLVAWYETSMKSSLKESESYNSAQTTEWYDLSPSSIITKKNKITKSAGADVTYQFSGINKTPTLQFNGSGKLTTSSFYQGSSAQNTVFLVFKTNFFPNSSQIILFDSYSGENRYSIGLKNNAVTLDAGGAVDTGTGSNPAAFTSNKDYIVAAYFNGSASGAYVNNATTMAGAATINAGTNSLVGVTIGTDKNGNSGFTGMISEVIIFNRPLKSTERKDIFAYLSKKYKISVLGL